MKKDSESIINMELKINVKFYLLLPGAGALIFSPTKHSLNKPRVLPK